MSNQANVKVSPLLWGRVQRACAERLTRTGKKVYLGDWIDAAIRKQLEKDEKELGLVPVNVTQEEE